MPTPVLPTCTASKKATVIGWILGGLCAAVLLFSASMKLINPPGMDKGFEHLGWPVSLALALGVLELSCALLYLIPPTAILGAILVTGYMGGAIATHVRIGEPFWMQALIGIVFWLGLYLRDTRLRALVPLRS